MKLKTIAALSVLAIGTIATQAHAGLSFNTLSSDTRTSAFNNISGITDILSGTSVSLGELLTDQLGTITYTYLGEESSFRNQLLKASDGSVILTEFSGIGNSVSKPVNSIGAVDFKFEGATGNFAINGGAWDAGTSIGLIGTDQIVNGNFYSFILGYNDSGPAGSADWDDFVIGINLAPIPEPESYALMLAGLGLMGAIARRRNKSKAL